jgi:hypothetical protein
MYHHVNLCIGACLEIANRVSYKEPVVSAYFVPIGQAADSALWQTYRSASESTHTVDPFNCDVVIHALEYAAPRTGRPL